MNYLQGPDDETLKRIQTELGEDPDRFENNLRLLEEWMKCQPHLPQNYDKRMLPIYLRACKHDLEKAKKKIEFFFLCKANLPELFENTDPERKDILEAVQVSPLAIMPNLTTDGYRVTICGLATNDVSRFKIDVMMAKGCMSATLRTVLETPTAGDVLIFDAKNMTTAHAAVFLTPVVRKSLMDGPEAFPNRLRQIHIVNAPSIIDRVVTIIKTLIKDKLRRRFFVHSSKESLRQYVPARCLPSDFGGTEPSLEEMSRRTHEFTKHHVQWLKEQEDVKLIGPVPEKFNCREDMGGGTDGSFRKLAID